MPRSKQIWKRRISKLKDFSYCQIFRDILIKKFNEKEADKLGIHVGQLAECHKPNF